MRVSRRDLFKWGATSLAAVSILPRCATVPPDAAGGDDCTAEASADKPLSNADWVKTARVAGLAIYVGQTVCELRKALDEMRDQKVSVVEFDPDLSLYLTEDDFKQNMALLDVAARECHQRGMRAVAYYPMFESLTPNAASTPHTMSKDHPDWVQKNLDGTENVFVGSNVAFWVEPGEESCWLCPTSGYADYFIDRCKRLAATALDGIWGDVPLFSDLEGYWPCANDTCRAKFMQDTGMSIPDDVDWSSPVFRRWIAWRHHVIWEFEQKVLQAVKGVRPSFELIVETVTMDYNGGTVQGLDGAANDDGGLYRIWEVDAVSDATGMRDAAADDWISMAVMMKHARAAAHPRPSWVFCYGQKEDDAEYVMALAIAAGLSPYETQIPLTNTSVGAAFRQRMFSWIGAHGDVIGTETAHDVAVLFSSTSRDFLDHGSGIGLYETVVSGDEKWWSALKKDKVSSLQYISDFRGTCRLLFDAHVPFDVLTTPHATLDALKKYRAVAAPSLVSVSADLAAALVAYVSGGGTLILTGQNPGMFDEVGQDRSQPLLAEMLGLPKTTSGLVEMQSGSGKVFFDSERTGHRYFVQPDSSMIASLMAALPPAKIISDAPPGVIFDLRDGSDGSLCVVMANLHGLGDSGPGAFTPSDAAYKVEVELGGRSVSGVVLAKPDGGGADAQLPFTMVGTKVQVTVSIHAVAALIIRS